MSVGSMHHSIAMLARKALSADDYKKLAFEKVETYRRAGRKIGRNELCPCKSGLKYKICHLDRDKQSLTH